MGWIVAGVICWNISHGVWGTILIIFGVLCLCSDLVKDLED